MIIHFGCLGNGITCYDVDRVVNNDYPTVAHISNGGNIHWYKENCKTMKPEAKALIENCAAKEREKAREYIESIIKNRYSSEIYRLLDRLPYRMCKEIFDQSKNEKIGLISAIKNNMEEILNYL